MQERKFRYRGIDLIVREEHPAAEVIVRKRKFKAKHVHEGGLGMWMCEEAYFASPDLDELARHFVDYGYLFDAPGRVVVTDGHDSHGHTPSPPPASTEGA